MEQSRQSIAEDEANYQNAKSTRWLHINGNASVQTQYETRINSDTSYNNVTFGPYASVYASQPVFHWGEFDARNAQARNRVAASKGWAEQRACQIRQDVRHNFIEYQLAVQSAAIAQDSIAYARRKQQGLQELLNRGLASKEDLLEADIFAQERQEDLDYALNQLAFNLDLLRETTGQSALKISTADFPQMQTLSDGELNELRVAAASAHLPSITAMEGELAAEEAAYKEIRTRNLPKINAVVSGNLDTVDEYRNGGNYANVPRMYAWAGIQANWTLYDSGSNDADKLACIARQRRIKARIDEARMAQNRDTANIARDASLNASRYETRLRRLELLKSTVALMEAQLELHAVPVNDLLQRKLDLQRTQLELVRANAYYMLDIAQLRELASYGVSVSK